LWPESFNFDVHGALEQWLRLLILALFFQTLGKRTQNIGRFRRLRTVDLFFSRKHVLQYFPAFGVFGLMNQAERKLEVARTNLGMLKTGRLFLNACYLTPERLSLVVAMVRLIELSQGFIDRNNAWVPRNAGFLVNGERFKQ